MEDFPMFGICPECGGDSGDYAYTPGLKYDEDSDLFAKFSGTQDATSYVAETGQSITFYGNAKIDSGNYKFGISSLKLDGSGDYATVPYSTSWELGTDDFTIDWWDYIEGYSSAAYGASAPISRDATIAYSPFILGYFATNIASLLTTRVVYITSTGTSWDIASAKSIGTLTFKTWNHQALVREGDTFYTFQNGVLQTTWESSASIKTNANALSIGRRSTVYFNGYISNVRVVKGTALWTSAFNLTEIDSTVDSSSNIDTSGYGVPLVWYQGRKMCEMCKDRLESDSESLSSAKRHAAEERFRAKAGFGGIS